MDDGAEAYDGNNRLPTTVEILGEHLHYKVTGYLATHPGPMKVSLSEIHLSDKLTGMLMENSEADIRNMLMNEDVLSVKVDQALNCLRDHFTREQDGDHHNQLREMCDLTHEELGDLVYERVSSVEEDLAPEITGMLLEIDPRTLMTLLASPECHLQAAIHKARSALLQTKGSAKSQSRSLRSAMESGQISEHQVMVQTGHDKRSDDERSDDESRDDQFEAMGQKVFEMAHCLHPHQSSQITGMILEMKQDALKDVIADPEKLKAAIEKAHRTWLHTAS